MLKAARHPMIFAGRGSRSVEHWNARVALAEALNAKVITDLKLGAVFPTDHPLYAGAPRTMSPDTLEAMRTADLVLSLDWVDLAGALKTAGPEGVGEDHPRLARPSASQRLEHGLRGAAAGRSFPRRRSRHHRGRVAGGARRERQAEAGRTCAGGGEAAAGRRRASERTPRAANFGRRSATGRPRSPTSRCPGTTTGGRSAIRSITSAAMAAAASAAAPASRSARRSRCAAPTASRSGSAATAIS